MPRIMGVDIPNDKPTFVSLQYIFGVGKRSAFAICEKAGIDPQTKAAKLTEDQLSKISAVLETDYTVEGALRR